MTIVKVEGDIPSLDFLDIYSGELMCGDDYIWAAAEPNVEKAEIKALAIVESGGAGFVTLGERAVPKILDEPPYLRKAYGY